MNKSKFYILTLAVILTLALCAAVYAEPEAKKDYGYYCTSGNCGLNLYNYNYGFNTGYYCSNSYLAPFRAEFIRDVNYPDGTYVVPGTSFTKTWRLRNSGTQAWTTDMYLVFVGGDITPVNIRMPQYVAPGSSVDISVRLTAPLSAATMTGQWMLKAPDGTLFGVGCNGATPIWVSLQTWSSGGCGCIGQSACSCVPTQKPKAGRNPYCNNKVREVKDLTIPDGTVVAPGATFRKSWRMKNGGTCVWDDNYKLTFFYGDDLGFDGSVSISSGISTSGPKYNVNRPKRIIVNPDTYVVISVDLTAPTTPGVYEAYFKLEDNLGYQFGFGSYADSAFWVNIIVADEASAKNADAGEKGGITKSVNEASVVMDEAVDMTTLEPEILIDPTANLCGEQTLGMRPTDTGWEVIWTAQNAGTADWNGYNLLLADANPAVSPASEAIAIPDTAAGETAEVSFNIDINGESADPLWMEFYLNSGYEDFCAFYFEAPAK